MNQLWGSGAPLHTNRDILDPNMYLARSLIPAINLIYYIVQNLQACLHLTVFQLRGYVCSSH